MIAQLSGRQRAEAFRYLQQAAHCREAARRGDGPLTAREWAITARWYLEAAADNAAAAAHSGARLP